MIRAGYDVRMSAGASVGMHARHPIHLRHAVVLRRSSHLDIDLYAAVRPGFRLSPCTPTHLASATESQTRPPCRWTTAVVRKSCSGMRRRLLPVTILTILRWVILAVLRPHPKPQHLAAGAICFSRFGRSRGTVARACYTRSDDHMVLFLRSRRRSSRRVSWLAPHLITNMLRAAPFPACAR